MALSGKQRRHLRALAHHLDPIVQLGKNGLNEAAIAAVAEALDRHELVKVRLGTECPDERGDVAERLAPATSSEIAGEIGRTILVWRKRKKDSRIELPGDEAVVKKGKGKRPSKKKRAAAPRA